MPRQRLVDIGGLPPDVARASQRERYQRGATAHTTLTWWARRPHAAMRAVVFAALADRSAANERLLTALADTPDEATLERARAAVRARGDLAAEDREHEGRDRARIGDVAGAASREREGRDRRARTNDAAGAAIRSQDCEPNSSGRTRILDPFAGGGTIPLEARRLGADVTAVDNNELAVFINRCWLELGAIPDAAERTAALGAAALEMVARLTAPLFPLRDTERDGARATNYLWTYAVTCECGEQSFLARRRWLSKKRGLHLNDALEIVAEGSPTRRDECAGCGATIARDVRDAEDRMTCVVTSGGGRKRYLDPTGAIPDPEVVDSRALAILGALGARDPATELPVWSGIVNPPLYGLTTHRSTFTPRQRAVLYAVIGAVREVTATLEDDERRFFRGVLSGLVDQCVDWNSRLSMWIPENEQVGRALSGPGVPMLWDFAETDPVGRGPANLWRKLDRIVAGVAQLPHAAPRGRAIQASAEALPFEDGTFDAVVTDPPYYDNIYYAALADFVFVWKRMLLEDDEPDLFGPPHTRTRNELVASRQRFGDDAHDVYTAALGRAVREMARVLAPDGALALVYSHASFDGWRALFDAFSSAPIELTNVLALPIERKQRPRAMSAKTVDTCFVFVARHRRRPRPRTKIAKLLATITADDPLLMFARGVAALANTARGRDTAGASGASTTTSAAALEALEATVRDRFGEFRLLRRRSL